MLCFQTKNPNLGKFWRVLQWKILVYFMTIWYILRPLEIFYGHLEYFVVIWYISPRFGILYQEKSGNRDQFYNRCVWLLYRRFDIYCTPVFPAYFGTHTNCFLLHKWVKPASRQPEVNSSTF
jgi:hypothetical protein